MSIPGYGVDEVERVLTAVRRVCLSLPETSERLSHGSPASSVGGRKTFVMVVDDHHGDARLAIWCAAPEGVQQEMVETEPDRFFRPPYVGHRGWLGVALLEIRDDELAAIVLDAYRTVAPKTLLARFEQERGLAHEEEGVADAGQLL